MLNIPIFFASDDNYSSILSVSICSICYNTKHFINFYILDGGIAEFHKKQIESLKNKFNNFDVEFIRVNTDEKFKNFKTTDYFPSLSTYSRFLIANIKPEFDKILYLDCDTIILDDIAKLYNEDLENYIRLLFYNWLFLMFKIRGFMLYLKVFICSLIFWGVLFLFCWVCEMFDKNIKDSSGVKYEK